MNIKKITLEEYQKNYQFILRRQSITRSANINYCCY